MNTSLKWCLMTVALFTWLSFANEIRAQQTESKGEDASDEVNENLCEPELELPLEEMTGSEYTTVVTASRSEMRRFETPCSIDVVDSKRRGEMQARSVPEELEETPGVYLQQTNRGSGAPIMRGLIGPQNLILVDGVRFNTSTFRTGPNQYLATFESHSLKRVEIVRGPSSVLYGNGAMGGVLHMITATPDIEEEKGFRGKGSTWFSSADTSPGGALNMEGRMGQWSLVGGGSYTYFGELRAGGGDLQPFTDYQMGSWRAKAIYSPRSSLTITGAYFGTRIADAGRTDRLGRGEVRFYDNDDHLAYLQVLLKGENALDRVKAGVSYHRLDEHIDRFQCNQKVDNTVESLSGCISLKDEFLSKKRRYNDTVDQIGADIDIGLKLLKSRLRLVGGAEVYQDLVGSTRKDGSSSDGFVSVKKDRGNFSDDSKYQTLGVYLHADILALDFGPKLGEIHITGGGRFSDFSASAPNVPGIGDVSYSYSGLVGSAGLQWLRPDLFNLYGSFVQGFRAPNLQETTVLGDTGSKFEIPNGDLRPERSDTIEFGGKLLLDSVEANVSCFMSFLKDTIDEETAEWEGQTAVDGAPVVRRVNAARGLYQGVEGSLAVHVWRFTASSGVAWIKGELTDAEDKTYYGRRIPPVFGIASLRYDHPDESFFLELYSKWALRQNALHPSDKKDLRICETFDHSGIISENCNGADPWYTLNLRGGYRFLERFRVDLALENFTDNKYKTHGSGFYSPGIDARGTLTVDF